MIGPCFFEDANGNSVTVQQVNCQEMIETFHLPQLRALAGRINNNVIMKTQCFQQDGTPTHTANKRCPDN